MRKLVTSVVVVLCQVAKHVADHLRHLVDEAQIAVLLLRYILIWPAEEVVGHIIREDSRRVQYYLVIVVLVLIICDKAPILLLLQLLPLQPLVVLCLLRPVDVVRQEAVQRHLRLVLAEVVELVEAHKCSACARLDHMVSVLEYLPSRIIFALADAPILVTLLGSLQKCIQSLLVDDRLQVFLHLQNLKLVEGSLLLPDLVK